MTITASLPRPAATLMTATEGRVDLSVLLGMDAAAEDDLAARPSCHDAVDGEHEHDDFDSFVVPMGEISRRPMRCCNGSPDGGRWGA